jgi:hypothetical protein
VLQEERGRVEKAAKRLGSRAARFIRRSRSIRSQRPKSRLQSEYWTSAGPTSRTTPIRHTQIRCVSATPTMTGCWPTPC